MNRHQRSWIRGGGTSAGVRDDQDHARHLPAPASLRWFLLAWEGLVYVWAVLYSPVLLGSATLCAQLGRSTAGCGPARVVALLGAHLGPVGAFTALLWLQAMVLWLGLAGKVPDRLLWPHVLAQAALVYALGRLVQQENVTLSLYLALTLGAINMLPTARQVALVGTGYIGLFLVSSLRGADSWGGWTLAFWSKSDDAALLLFAIGYLLLYVQRTRIHTQLAAAHRDLTATHAALAAAHDHVRASSARIEELTRLTERQRLARELHDTLAQGLVGLTLQLETVDGLLTLNRAPQAQEIVQQALARARATLADARGAIDDLRAVGADARDLAVIVRDEVQHVTAATGLACHTDLEDLDAIPLAFHEPVRRLIAEGLTNIARHARASQAWIRLRRGDGLWCIEVRDDGGGFNPRGMTTRLGHYGLRGLEERARAAGGHLEIISAPGAGTTLRLALPAQADQRGERDGAVAPTGPVGRHA